jgi:N utilization substance protein A
MAGNLPRTEFAQALRAIATERGLEADVILGTLKEALEAAYRRDAKERGEETEGFVFEVQVDKVTGEAKIFRSPEDKPTEKKDVTPPGFGRIAAQTAKQVIRQKIREAEKDMVMGDFEAKVGNLVSGIVLRFEGADVRVDIGRTEGMMLAQERVPSERLEPSQRLSFLLKAIEETPRGKQIVLSRADPEFVAKLFAREVPEVSSGSVEIKKIAREPGVRTKIVVDSNQPGVDPVGSCVGQKGVRVQAVTNELGGERIDIIPWSENIQEFIKSALSPAEVKSIKIDEKKKEAIVQVEEPQLAIAIGKDGQNVRLATRLTDDWKIEVVEAVKKVKVKKVKKTKTEAKGKKAKSSKKETAASRKKVKKAKEK